MGTPLVAARSGQSPLAHGLSIVLDREADVYREGVAGRKVPLRWVAEDRRSEDREDASSHISSSMSVPDPVGGLEQGKLPLDYEQAPRGLEGGTIREGQSHPVTRLLRQLCSLGFIFGAEVFLELLFRECVLLASNFFVFLACILDSLFALWGNVASQQV